MRILNAKEVAHYLLVSQPRSGTVEPITNLKLQKLCYYAQGFSLVRLKRPLFSEAVEHWPHGPIVPVLWREFKGYGKQPIPIPDRRLYDRPLDSDVVHLLDEVIGRYGSLSAWELRNKSHAEPPWRDTPDECPITHQKLRAYFEAVVEEMARDGQSGVKGFGGVSLAERMASDSLFKEKTEKGLAELARGEYLTRQEFRKTLADI